MRALAHIDGGIDREGMTYIGVLLVDSDTNEVLLEHADDAGPGSHNDAEYRALLYALREAEALGVDELDVKADSRLVVKQVNGEWRIRKPHLVPYVDEARRLSSRFATFSLSWIPRKQNAGADRLTRIGRVDVS
jgi:probable phosphoglycerate mutase